MKTFPLYSPGIDKDKNDNIFILVADLRKNKSFLSFCKYHNRTLSWISESEFITENFSSFSEMVKEFVQQHSITENYRISVAVPGPVISGSCKTTNLPWILDEETIKNELNVENVILINDLEAVAYNLANVEEKDLTCIHCVEEKVSGNVALIAPGNGLGEAGLFWDGKFLRPFATEGGHTEFSPRNDQEVKFYQFLNKIYGIVTWENVLTKNGLFNIYRFLRDVAMHKEENGLSEKIQKNSDFLEVLYDAKKENNSQLINLTIDAFFEFLSREANNLALKFKATGGLVITGEIVEKLYELIDKDKFYRNFKISDKMEHLLKDIPIYILKKKKQILEGAAYYGSFHEKQI